MTTWKADFSNDPARDFDLYAELLDGDQYKARLFYDETKRLWLQFYGGNVTSIPFDLLMAVSAELNSLSEQATECKKPRKERESGLVDSPPTNRVAE